METSAQTTAHRYFTEFLPEILGQLLVEDLVHLSSCFAIEITDDPRPAWLLTIEEGRLTSVCHRGAEPVCRFRMGADTLIDVVCARVVPSQAFFDLEIELDGDVETGLKLSTVLEPFFERFPFSP